MLDLTKQEMIETRIAALQVAIGHYQHAVVERRPDGPDKRDQLWTIYQLGQMAMVLEDMAEQMR